MMPKPRSIEAQGSGRLAMHEESTNGRAKRWLAGGERRGVLTLAIGKIAKGEEASAGRLFL
jgi:hypothetical protein